MAWTLAVDPLLPAPPVVHSATRCMNCGHEFDEHNDVVGCLVEGGTKYVENEKGEGMRACSCKTYVPKVDENA